VPPLLVHMVHAGADDRRIAREAGAPVVLCPRSNLHIGGRLPDVAALLADGIALAVGTDSLASTPDLSLWGELATLSAHFPAVPAARWLEAATSGGARALGLPALGTFTPGKRPGVLDVLVDDVAAPVESLVRDPHPSLRWVTRA
jgi:cytosine/adenosine deaminase-related metal-dependent hydrolase